MIVKKKRGQRKEKGSNDKYKEKIRTGKPCGDDNFYAKIKSLTLKDYKNKNKKPRPKKEED